MRASGICRDPFSEDLEFNECISDKGFNTVRPKSVAGEASHVRLERPIDSSSDNVSVHRR